MTEPKSWWAKRWMSLITVLPLDRRLNEGRLIAQSGSLRVDVLKAGRLECTVLSDEEATEAKEERAAISLSAVSEQQLSYCVQKLCSSATMRAELLRGQMPLIENLPLKPPSASIPLFPRKFDEIDASCTCDDWVSPCKHIIALHTVIAQTIEVAPEMLLELRGVTWNALIPQEENDQPEKPQPLPASPEHFWFGATLPKLPNDEGQLPFQKIATTCPDLLIDAPSAPGTIAAKLEKSCRFTAIELLDELALLQH